jgi:hypothetical protein
MIKADLTAAKNDAALQYLDEVLLKINFEESDFQKKIEFAVKNPRALLQELCLTGLSQGVSLQENSKNINYLKLATDLMNFR